MSETDLEHQAERRAYWRSEANRLAAEKMELEDEIARLREREARERSANHRLVLDVQEMEQRAEAAEARVARLEEALREIANARTFPIKTDEIARRALAHEEEAEPPAPDPRLVRRHTADGAVVAHEEEKT